MAEIGYGYFLVGCFGFNGPLRQYFSLFRAVSQREGERGEIGQMREKMSNQPPPAPTASATGPCPTIIQISRTPRHWKFDDDELQFNDASTHGVILRLEGYV